MWWWVFITSNSIAFTFGNGSSVSACARVLFVSKNMKINSLFRKYTTSIVMNKKRVTNNFSLEFSMWKCHFISGSFSMLTQHRECAIVRLTRYWANGENWRVAYGTWAQYFINVNILHVCVFSVCEASAQSSAMPRSGMREMCVVGARLKWSKSWNTDYVMHVIYKFIFSHWCWCWALISYYCRVCAWVCCWCLFAEWYFQ